MKISYYKDTDSLYLELLDGVSFDSKEISEGVIADYDKNGKLVRVDIDNASKNINISEVILTNIPSEITLIK
ncbi:MAG: DUF2283 domain-containing protein [Ignavibacteria bacterium]